MSYLFISLIALALLIVIGVPYLIDDFEVMQAFKKKSGESISDQLMEMMGFHRPSHG